MKEKMKRTVILVLALAMVLCMPAAAFADTAATTTTAALTPISVSLSDAKAKMLEGVQGELLEIGKLTDKIAATSASEGLSSIREGENAIKNLYAQAASTTNATDAAMALEGAQALRTQLSAMSKTDIQRTKKYAESILEPNDKARHNALDLQSTEMYYKLKSAEEGLA
ncbi:MAG: hypothetical protein J5622_04815, partial [Firmicutes bacterium]|nr:hypothetical protein [Bacillota bacterium]